MKKIFFPIFVFVAAFAGSPAHAQIITKQAPVKKNTTIRTIPSQPAPVPPPAPAPAPPPASAQQPVTKQAPVASDLVYSLTSVRVKIRTGNDNKEFPSKVSASLCTRNTPSGDYKAFYQWNVVNEMKINSDTEFGLEREAQLRGESKLDAFQSSGLRFIMRYSPNFFADAWKIENITLVLEFKDQFGNLHPSLGTKTIMFNDAYGFLNNDYQIMECVTDGSFAPLTAVIKKL